MRKDFYTVINMAGTVGFISLHERENIFEQFKIAKTDFINAFVLRNRDFSCLLYYY